MLMPRTGRYVTVRGPAVTDLAETRKQGGPKTGRSAVADVTPAALALFWARADRSDPEACWTWTGHLNRHGYGILDSAGRKVRASRLAFELANGPLQPGLVVCHSCDTPACVNPAHLWAGTQADNLNDMRAKGRSRIWPFVVRPGEACNFAKLRPDDVRAIRATARTGATYASIARSFGISPANVSFIVRRKTWAHLPVPAMSDIATIPIVAASTGTWDAAWSLAQRIANTPFVPGALRNRPEAVLACVLYGQELGLGPMQSLAQIHVIDGRPAAAPELMRGMIVRAGHRLDITSTDEACTITGTRADNASTATVTWTMADAQRAGLTGKGAWKTYPSAMLLARATSALARMLFADVIAGLSYTPEEVQSISGSWDVIDEPAQLVAPPPDPVMVTFDRLRGLGGDHRAELVRQFAADHGHTLTPAGLADPGWRVSVDQFLDALEELDELDAVVDVDPVEDHDDD